MSAGDRLVAGRGRHPWKVTGAKRVMGLLLALVALSWLSLGTAGCSPESSVYRAPKGGAAAVSASRFGSRVLFVAPHPDDEGLAAAGLIRQCLSGGQRVKVVVVTAGDGSRHAAQAYLNKEEPGNEDFREIGRLRMDETRKAMARLGLPEQDLVFLGYPDGGTVEMWDFDWDFSSLHTGANGATGSPYAFSYRKNAPYCGRSLQEDLSSIVRDFDPTSIVYPDKNDSHHDHWAVNAFVQYVLIEQGYRGIEYTYLVHRHDFPDPKGYLPESGLEPPTAMIGRDTPWLELTLSAADEALKDDVLRVYVIPRMVVETFIDSFVRRNELFGISKESVTRRSSDPKPDFTAEKLPYVVLRDTDKLKSASLCVGDETSYLAVESSDPIDPGLYYIFHLRLFGGRTPERLDIVVRDGFPFVASFAGNSLRVRAPVYAHVAGNRLWVEVPGSLFKDRQECLYGVSSFNGHDRINNTVWQRVKIEG